MRRKKGNPGFKVFLVMGSALYICYFAQIIPLSADPGTGGNPIVSEQRGIWKGLVVDELTPGNKTKFRLKETMGVVIIKVVSRSPADLAGLRAGDVIIGINNEIVYDLSDYKRLTSAGNGDYAIRTSRANFIIRVLAE